MRNWPLTFFLKGCVFLESFSCHVLSVNKVCLLSSNIVGSFPFNNRSAIQNFAFKEVHINIIVWNSRVKPERASTEPSSFFLDELEGSILVKI